MKQFDLENLVFRRSPRFTLEIDGFSLDSGEKVAVVGPNGSGKSTLLRLLGSLERPDSWTRFLFRGQHYAAGKMDRKGLGFLRQQPVLFRGSVTQNLSYPLKLERLSREEIHQRVDAMLALMDLHHLAGSQAHHLSVGEKRRLALGRVLIARPETLLLDEPFAHLDARSQTVIEDVLVGGSQTILLTSHDVHFAHRVAHRVVSLKGGRTCASLSVNVIQGQLKEGRLVTSQGLRMPLPGTVSQTQRGSVQVTLDPRKMNVSTDPPVPGDQSQLKGHISSIREQGDEVWLEIECGHRITAIVGRGTYEKEGLNLHREVYLTFGPDAVEVL